jgi:hypothetical protein
MNPFAPGFEGQMEAAGIPEDFIREEMGLEARVRA